MINLPNEPLQSYLNSPNPLYDKGLQVKSLFWPCSVFAVSIYVSESSALNLFEKAVLKLADQGIKGTQATDMLCLDESFFKFIDARLTQQGYLTPNGSLTPQGRNFTQGKASGQHQTVYIYREEVSGSVLPYCVIKQPPYLQSDDHGPFFNTISNKRRINSPCIIYPTRRNNSPPAESEVQKALEKFIFKSRQVAHLPDTINYALMSDQIPLEPHLRVKIQPDSHFLYLHCVCSLGTDGRSILIWDPFGYNATEQILIDALARSEDRANMVMEALKGLTPGTNTPALPEPGFTRNLPYSLRPLYSASYAFKMLKMEENSSQMRARRSRRDWGRNFLERITHTLENMFLEFITQFVQDNGQPYFDAFLAGVAAADGEANRERMLNAARILRFSIIDPNDRFAILDARGVQDYRHGHPNLRVLFNINMLLAQIDLAKHPLTHLAEKFPHIIEMIKEIQRLRNAFVHSDMDMAIPGPDRLVTWFKLACTLYRNWHANDTPALALLDRIEKWVFEEETPKETASAETRDTSASKNEFFTASQLNALPQPIYEKFMEADRAMTDILAFSANGKDTMISQSALVPVSGFLEMLLRHDRPIQSEPLSEPLKTAVAHAQESGFALNEGLPLAIQYTASQKIRKALSGKKETLGAEVISWLVCQPQEYLVSIAKKSPRFLEHLGQLIELRGHGRDEISAQAAWDCGNTVFQDCQAILDKLKGV